MKKTFLVAALALGFGLGANAQTQTTLQPSPQNTQKAREDSAAAHVELAASYFQAGRLDVAQEELQKVLAQDPRNSMANDLLGVIHLKNGSMGLAEQAFRSALATDPGNGSAQNNYGMLLCQTNRAEAGMEAFGRALQSPKGLNIAQTLVNGGICLSRKNDHLGAEKFFLKALEQEPFMPSALFQLAKVYYATQRYPQAASRLAALHKQVAPNAASTFLMYELALAENKPTQAQSLSRLLQTQFPDSPEAQRTVKN